MTGFYDDMAATAAEMIAEYGQPVTISTSEPGEYDTDTATSAPGAPATVTAMGVVTAYKAAEVDGSLVRNGDRKLSLSTVDTAGAPVAEPKTGSRATLANGSKWTVMVVEAANPAGTPLVYRLQLRA